MSNPFELIESPDYSGQVIAFCPNGEMWDWFVSENQAEIIIASLVELAANTLHSGGIMSEEVTDAMEINGYEVVEQAVNAICIAAM